MRFLSIDIESFCSIGSAHLQLSEQGLVVVSGKNIDAEAANSNGSGKSTLVVDSICWALFGKTTKGGPADAVTPGGNGKGTRVVITFESGGHTYIVARHRKHKTHANRLLIEKDGQAIGKATTDDSEKLLQNILGITLDTFLYTTILGQGMMFRFTQLTDQQRKEVLEQIAATTIYENARVAARDASKTCGLDITTATSVIQAMQSSLDTLTRQKEDATKKQAEANAIVAAEKQILFMQRAALDPQLAAAKAALDSEQASVPSTELQSTLRQVEQKALTAMYEVSAKVATAKSELKRHEDSLRELYKILERPTCSLCGNVLTDEHKKAEEQLRTSYIEASRSDVAKLEGVLASAHGQHQTIASELEKVVSKERESNIRLSNFKSNLQNLERQRDLLESRMNSLESGRTDFLSIIESIARSEEDQRTKIQAQQKKISDLQTQKEAYDFWVTGFQDIRVSAVDSLLSFLNSRLAYYTNILCGSDIKVTLSHNEKGKIDLEVSTGGNSYQSASGGEKDRVDIAMAFSLLDLARQCTNWSSNILVLDEIAVYVDDAGIQRFMQVVQDLMGSVESCFLISHSPVFEGYGEKLLTVTKQSGISTVSAA